jgi:uncharacterized phage protein (TIGR01671 family)
MNREIEFRAWEHDRKKMCYGYQYNIGDAEQNNYPLMQKTGINDIKGKAIFEGDILKVGENLVCEIVYVEKNVEDYGDEIHSAFHAKVYRHNKTIPLDSYLKNNCVLIGNVYENPELVGDVA